MIIHSTLSLLCQLYHFYSCLTDSRLLWTNSRRLIAASTAYRLSPPTLGWWANVSKYFYIFNVLQEKVTDIPHFTHYHGLWQWFRVGVVMRWENDGNTGDAKIFRHIQDSGRIIALHHMFLYCSWQLILCWTCPLGGIYPSVYIQWRRGYKKGNRVGYNMILIRTLSLLAYFTYISIDIIIYALESTSWSSEIFWMVGWPIADPSLGLLSPCDVIPQVLILISSPRVIGKWVDTGWSGSSLSMTNLSGTQFQELSTLAWNC
jgi:hypothetical protein